MLKPEIDLSNIDANKLLSKSYKCGYHDCHGTEQDGIPKITRPQESTVYLLCFIYVALIILSILIIIFGLNTYNDNKKTENKKSRKKFSMESTLPI